MSEREGSGDGGPAGSGRGRPCADGRRVVTSAWAAGRTRPDQRSEMSTQWLFGEVLSVVGADGPWLRVRGPGGYASWVHRGGLGRLSPAEVGAWDEEATGRSLGARVTDAVAGPPDPAAGPGRGSAERPSVPRHLPWGARVALAGDGRARLPGGRTVGCDPRDAIVAPGEREARFPPEPGAVAETALGWRGVPYLWGGRTREGADCSGFVQAVHLLHGVRLPRDSGDQLAAAGAGAVDPGAREPGDLLFFGDGPGDVTHVALVVGGGLVVHAAAENGAVAVDDLEGSRGLSSRLRTRLVGATRPLAGEVG